jgi:hypothetical protein
MSLLGLSGSRNVACRMMSNNLNENDRRIRCRCTHQRLTLLIC